MTKLKFVSATKPAEYADQFHTNLAKIKRLRETLRDLEEEQEQLGRFLLKHSKNESFKYNSADGYEKVFKVKRIEMFVLNQQEVKRMLKKRTPYKDVSFDRLSVDWVYTNSNY